MLDNIKAAAVWILTEDVGRPRGVATAKIYTDSSWRIQNYYQQLIQKVLLYHLDIYVNVKNVK